VAGRRTETQTRRRAVRKIAAGLLLAGLACDGGAVSPPPTAVCDQAGAQCQLPEGPLGVCERSACEAGAAAPCFQCISQH